MSDLDERRRALLSLPFAAAGAAFSERALGQAATGAAVAQGPSRIALLIGNRVYPAPFELPPVYKNVRDLSTALERRGFSVTSALDQNPTQLRAAIDAFAKIAASSPPDATILFYYTGHGMQIDAENLMLGSGVAPDSREDKLLSSSLRLQRDVIDQLPRRSGGLTIAVVDACRTSLRAALTATDGFNQVEAPLGCLIVFSTGAGKPAIAPAVETLSTFYTASLVKLLSSAADETSFSDLFRLVKFDVQQTMENYPVQAIRQFTQIPFIAENTQVRFQLAQRPERQSALPQFSAADEAAAWRELEENLWPADIVKLAEAYLQHYPSSKLAGGAQVAREGAADAVKALHSNQVRLFRSAFQPKTSEPRWLAEWRKAARGDKDAAARIARAYLRGQGEIGADPNRYEGWMQYAAALGNGIASYELAVYYRGQSQPVPAAQYETRARDLGYTPPSALDNVRK
ncbi:MAG: caspase family protein [Caldimonas sp.]